MATYAIGDIQGCFRSLERLLESFSFDPARDRLWLAGDLVNRGPDSLAVLRWARSLGERTAIVLGNHDLHLLAMHYGGAPSKRRDTLGPIFDAPDRAELLDWLRRQELLHREQGFVMVHAGLLPDWSVDDAEALAREVEEALRRSPEKLFERMYGDQPARWRGDLKGADRHRIVINALTRMRMLDERGELVLSYSDAPEKAPPGLVPWFDVPGRPHAGVPVICGHWAALGLVMRDNLIALDTGCVWGRQLTAVRLEDREVFQVDAVERREEAG